MNILSLLNFVVLGIILFGPQQGYSEAKFEPIAVYLSWKEDPTTTMVVNWVTPPNEVQNEVYYRGAEDPEWKIAIGSHAPFPQSEPYNLHRVELTGLTPNSIYYFRAGWTGLDYKFKTMPATLDTPIKFVSGGDMYHDDVMTLEQTNKQAARQNPDFAIVGGDIAYACSSKSGKVPNAKKRARWITWLKSWYYNMVTPDGFLIPMVATIGNHDVDGHYGQPTSHAPFFYLLFPFPGEQGCNVLDFGNYLSLFALDSGHTHPIAGPQTYWLYQALQMRENMPHKIAFYHVPAYPSIQSNVSEETTLIRQNWVPIFEKFGLHTALEHHSHTYKRTHPINGVLYLGDGAWGVKKPRVPDKPTQNPYLAVSASTRHFLLTTLANDYRYYQAIDYAGTIIDFCWQEAGAKVGY